MWRLASHLRRGEDKVCACYIVVASFKVGLGGHRATNAFCYAKITDNTNVQSVWAQNCSFFGFSAKMAENFI